MTFKFPKYDTLTLVRSVLLILDVRWKYIHLIGQKLRALSDSKDNYLV